MEEPRFIVQVFVGAISPDYEALSIEAVKATTAEEMVNCIAEKLDLPSPESYELAEVIGNAEGQECKERRLASHEPPVQLMLLWPKLKGGRTSEVEGENQEFRFYLRERLFDSLWSESVAADPQLIRDYLHKFLYQPVDREYPDLCQLPDLNETTLLENLKARFDAGHIYTYVGSILIAVNPFKFYPIYNPKYVKLYQNRRLGELPPHIFAVADAAYHSMLRERRPQCIVISGESGSGKTESTNFLLHHLTALSQKGTHGSGVEQTILSAGPVLEAFGNAKTAHNNNSSRFGKFIQVTYRENGLVHGALVQKYLLEKSRICYQAKNERNYHVFYHLLGGCSDHEKRDLYLKAPADYRYLNQSDCADLSNVDESYEFSRLKQSMEMVGFPPDTQAQIFAVLSAVLQIGNVDFQPKKSSYHHDESVLVRNPEVATVIADLLRVKEETLLAALVSKTARASGETLVINYRMAEAIGARDAMAKCLYAALFDWIVLQLNHALLAKKEPRGHNGYNIGVLDIFGFEDFGNLNSFEQFCINYANEHLQSYFNMHVFKYEQEEYRREGLKWVHIHFEDNTGCLALFEARITGLLCILDDQCSFPGATNETLLHKFHTAHKENEYYEVPQKREPAFIIRHYAGKVKYQVAEFREKNLDLIHNGMVAMLKSSKLSFVRQLVSTDPVAVFRWAILRAFLRGVAAFNDAGRRYRTKQEDTSLGKRTSRYFQHETSLMSDSSSTNHRPLRRLHVSESNVKANGNTSSSRMRIRSSQPNGVILSSPYPVVQKRMSRVTSVFITSENNNEEHYVLTPADKIIRSRSHRPRSTRPVKTIKSLSSVKNLVMQVGTTTAHHKGPGARKTPGTVAAQFQISLQSLLVTLNTANPFFVRCIKSNSDKAPHIFDESNVQRQLRYTGMLETVRIRQSGFNVRLTYDEFIHMYRILLPKGLLSSQSDVADFIDSAGLNRDHYQVGCNKIFLRETEKAKLDTRLHQTILASIVTIQRWFRANMERRNYQSVRAAVIKIQSYVRMFLAQRLAMNLRMRNMAATFVQKVWRGYRVRKWYTQLRCSVVQFQSRVRGNLVRQRFASMREEERRRKDPMGSHSTDEAFLSKEPSQEELDEKPPSLPEHILDSEGSSGIQEDSEGESFSDPAQALQRLKFPTDSPSPPVSPFGPSYVSTSSNFLYEAERKYSSRNITYARTASYLDGERIRNKLALKLGPPIKPLYKSSLTSPLAPSPFRTVSAEEVNLPSGSRKLERADSDSDTEGTLVSSSRSTVNSTSTSISTLSSLDSERKREQRRLERRKVIAERNPLRSRANSQTEETIASALGGLHVYTASIPIHKFPAERRYSRDSDHGSPYQRRGSKESIRSFDTDASSENLHQRLERRESKPTRRNSYATALDPSPSKGDPLRLGEELPSPEIGEGSGKGYRGSAIPPVSQHKLTRCTKLYKNELCAMCSKTMIFSQGFKCAVCRRVFHAKCVYNGGCGQLVCDAASPERTRNPEQEIEDRIRSKSSNRKHSKERLIDPTSSSNWSLTGTSEFTDSVLQVVTSSSELMKLDEFIVRKIHEMGPCDKTVDRVFVAALKEFKANLLATSSVSASQLTSLNLTYRDLIVNFGKVMEIVLKRESAAVQEAFPLTMGVNAFRGYLNEFVTHVKQHVEKEKVKESKSKPKRKKDKWRKERRRKEGSPEVVRFMEHEFMPLSSVITIPTACEVCSSFTWLKEKGLVCQVCKLACHRKCYTRIVTKCSLDEKSDRKASAGPESGKVFGAPLESLVHSGCKVPIVVEKLISSIEMLGLYSEGIYRKSGVTSKVHQLKKSIEDNLESVDFMDYPVHVLTSVLKSYLRDLPEPIITPDVYENLLRAADISDQKERVSTLFTALKKLPPANYDLMERLVFHLARVAQNEASNRMSANSLAIVLTPCILRPPASMPAQDSLDAVTRQTKCLEAILSEQAMRISATMKDIDTLDTAYHAAARRLSTIRSSKSKLGHDETPSRESSPAKPLSFLQDIPSSSYSDEQISPEEEEMLKQQIMELQEEIADLAACLPSLIRATSEDDLLSTDLDLDPLGSLDEIRCPPSPGSDLSVISGLSSHHHESKRRRLRDQDKSGPGSSKLGDNLPKTSQPKISLTGGSSIVSQMVKMKEDAIKRATRPKGDGQFVKSVRVRSRSSRNVTPTLSDTSVTSVQEGEDAILV